MNRVTGIGGIFIKAQDPEAMKAWYKRHLGLDIQGWGGVVFRWHTPERPEPEGATVWSVFPASSNYFAPSQAPFMVNYRVDDLHGLLALLRQEGCRVEDKVQDSEYGKFGWVIDPEGNKVELWQPPPGKFGG
jgi:catechol 2,3-dioxygenase-like lactoylglutathione lyase family enzyme